MPEDAPNDHDVLANQLALHNAQQTSTAKSLAAQFGDSDGEDSDGSNHDRTQEEKMNVRASELIGIGYQAPNDGDEDASVRRQESAATERLRKQLLGKNARAPRGALTTSGAMMPGQKFAASKARPKLPPKRDASEDEDEGRSSMGRSRRIATVDVTAQDNLVGAGDEDGPTAVIPAAASKKRGGSYLDQVLAERAAKKKRKRKSKSNNEQT